MIIPRIAGQCQFPKKVTKVQEECDTCLEPASDWYELEPGTGEKTCPNCVLKLLYQILTLVGDRRKR